MVPGFELTAFETWVSSHNHLTRAPAFADLTLGRSNFDSIINFQKLMLSHLKAKKSQHLHRVWVVQHITAQHHHNTTSNRQKSSK